MALFQSEDIIGIKKVNDNSDLGVWKNSIQKNKPKLEEEVRQATIFGSKNL